MAGEKRTPPAEEKTLPDGLEPPTPRNQLHSRDHISIPPEVIVPDEDVSDVDRSPLTGWPLEVHLAFQRLWTKAVGQPGYDKQEWNRLRALLDRWLLPPGSAG